MSIKIEKNVKLPETTRNGRASKYPFAKMEIGDSFVAKNPSLVRGSAYAFASRNKKYKFAVRIGEDGKVRCWRIKP